MMHKLGSPFLASIYEQMLTARYAMATINAYLYWIKFFIRDHQLRRPLSRGEAEVQQFLTFLACERRVAAKTQAQALNALVFFTNLSYRALLGYRWRSNTAASLPSCLVSWLKQKSVPYCWQCPPTSVFLLN
ncbi:site-specific integrase [Aeromonas caviae]